MLESLEPLVLLPLSAFHVSMKPSFAFKYRLRRAILVDEIQYLSKKGLGALIMAMHKLQQRQFPVLLIAARLPMLTGLAGEPKSYAERLYNFQKNKVPKSFNFWYLLTIISR